MNMLNIDEGKGYQYLKSRFTHEHMHILADICRCNDKPKHKLRMQ